MGELRYQGWSPPHHPGECRLCSLPLARSRAGGGFWGAWQDPGCWKGPEQAAANAETHPGVTLDPSMGRGERQQQWQEGRSGRGARTRDTGCRTNTAPEQAALPSPSLPRTPGVSSHMRVGVTAAEGAKKEQEAAAAEPREPFYCTAEQGMEGQRRKHLPQGSARPSQQEHGAGRGPGSRREPHHVPSAPHTGAAARARVPDSPGWVDEAMEAMCRGRGTVPSSAGHFCSPWHTPAFTQPSGRACTRS